MTVYLVKTYEYEQILFGIFSTEERARAFITKNKLTETYIESEEVDKDLVLPEPTPISNMLDRLFGHARY